MPEENPFEPTLDGVPLVVTLDGRSLSSISGRDLDEALFLLSLCHHSPFLDAVVLGSSGVAHNLPEWYVAEPDPQQDYRLICQRDTDLALGGVQPWSSRERRVDDAGLSGLKREWSLYYEAATWFHQNSDRHLFITADKEVVEKFGAAATGSSRQVFSVRGALLLIGLLMRTRDCIYIGRGSEKTSNFNFYFLLSHSLAPARIRLHQWHGARGPADERGDLLDLEQSMAVRVVDLMKAVDGVAFQWLRHQDNATLDEMLYHLRAAVPTATALFDSIALFAAGALGVEATEVRSRARISLRDATFRRALQAKGGHLVAEASSECGPLWKMLGELRNPVIHGSGISGMTYQALGTGLGRESRLTLRRNQAEAVLATTRWAGDKPEHWGLEPPEQWSSIRALDPLLEPYAFSRRFVSLVIRTADRLVSLLADDLGAPTTDDENTGRETDLVWRLGLLGGVADDLAPTGPFH